MERIELTRSIQPLKYLLLIVAFFSIREIFSYHTTIIPDLIAAGIAICSITLAYLIHNMSSIEFDDKTMFVSNRRFQEQIFLKNVIEIKLTSGSFNDSHFWKICYFQDTDEKRTIFILPKNLAHFQENVKMRDKTSFTANGIY